MKPLDLRGKFLFGAVNVAGCATFLWVSYNVLTGSLGPTYWGYIVLLLATLAAGILSVKIPGINSMVSLSDTFVFTAVIFFGPAPAALLAGADGFVSTRKHTKRLLSAFSSLSVLTMSVLVSGWVFRSIREALWGGSAQPLALEQMLLPVGAMALVHFALNSTLVAALTAAARRLPVYATWKEHYLWTSFSFFSGAFAASLTYVLVQRLGLAAFLVAIAILAITYLTYQTYLGSVEAKNLRIAQMNKVHLATIEALAMAIDAKGQTTFGHLRRVQSYAVGLGNLLGVDENTLEGIRAAALLHDVGKLAVPDYILNKPGSLTAAEREKLKTYPRIGAEILGNVAFPYPVLPMVRHHREHWDGTGYPDGLVGEKIPLGARILAIADTIDSAVRCPRPHRASVSRDAIVGILTEGAGSRYDPALVELFCSNIDRIEALVDGTEVPEMGGMNEIASIHREHAATLFEEENSRPALRDISASRTEALSLYDLARDLGSSLSLKNTLDIIMERLGALVSFDSGVIYLIEGKTGLLIPACVAGESADVLRRKTFRRGEGITGWVADNGAAMINARPELDFYGADIEVGRLYLSAAVVPLELDGSCIGTITLYSRSEGGFGSEDERLLDLVRPQAAAAIRNARSYEETRDRAMTDSLTELPNSRYLYMQLEQEIAKAQRTARPLGIVVIDLDHFKPINDGFGHHVGDEVLRQVARCLTGVFRRGDSVCRWAGDEFVVLLPESDPDFVESIVGRAQKAVDELEIDGPQGRTVKVGASAGWAIYPLDGDGFEELMRIADKKMYRNKAERHQANVTIPS